MIFVQMLFTTVKYKMSYFNENMACIPISFSTSIPSGCIYFFFALTEVVRCPLKRLWWPWGYVECRFSFSSFFFFTSPSSKVNIVLRIWVLYSSHLGLMTTAFFLMVKNTQYFSISITFINWIVNQFTELHGFLYYMFLGLKFLKIHCLFHIFLLV